MGQGIYWFGPVPSIAVAFFAGLSYSWAMELVATAIITLLAALLGFLAALKLTPDRKENREKFLMTAIICIALAMVLSGFVRRPVVRMIREQCAASYFAPKALPAHLQTKKAPAEQGLA